MHLVVAEGLDHFQSHWTERPGWRPGRTKYAFHLTMEHCPQVQGVARRVQRELAGFTCLAPVPQRWLHLTMTGVGFSDQVSPQQLQQVAAPVFHAWQQVRDQPLVGDGLLLAGESVRLVFRDDDWLQELASVQRRAVDRVLGAQEWRRFRPHVSLAYGIAQAPLEPLLAAVRPLSQTLPEQTVDHPTLTLLELSREQPLYHWQVLRQA